MMRLLLRCLPLGERRDEIESDLRELFDLRRRERGRLYACARLFQDLTSLVLPTSGGRGFRPGVSSWLLDLRHALRLFRKHPTVIGATVGGLALAIAVCTTVFTILNAKVIRPYGMDDPRSVVRVQRRFAEGFSTDWPYQGFAGLREAAHQSQVIASLQENVRFSLTPAETPTRVDTLLFVSGNYLQTLGGRAILGRTLRPSDDEPGADPVVVVNHRFWTSRLNGDRAIAGKTIRLSGVPVTVVGVIDPAFTGPADKPASFWAPFGSYGAIFRERPMDRTSTAQVQVFARVGSGTARTAAEQELSAIASTLPDIAIKGESGRVIPVTGVRLDGAASPMDGEDSSLLVVVAIILLIVGLVLALACANVANLLLAGASARTREIGVRLALGASQRRILRQFLSESLMIGMTAGAAGLLLSLWAVPIVSRLIGFPETYDVRPDLTVILFTAAIAIVSGTMAGLAPARHGARGDLLGVLKSQSGPSSAAPPAIRMRRLFIGFQAAASIVLLVTAALFLRGAMHLVRVDLGFDADRLVTVVPAFPRSGFEAPAVDAYWRSAIARVRAIPSVEHVAMALSPPFGGVVSMREIPRLRRSGVPYRLFENRTDAEYFVTAGLHIVRGRTYTAGEVNGDANVALVSESVVRDFFSGKDPIGSSLAPVGEDLSSLTIIGVVGEALTSHLRGDGNGVIYRPHPASVYQAARLIIRSPHPETILRDVETALLSVDDRVRPTATLVSEGVERYMNEPKILAGLSGTVALLALVLAVLGVYGVTTFVVHQRMWEMHVRQAIGASAGDIVRLLVRQSLTPVAMGLVAGLAMAIAGVRVLGPALSGVSPYDPAAIGGAVAILMGSALAAVISPAVRAAHSDPAAVLRAG